MVEKNSYVVWCLANQALGLHDYENFCSSRTGSFFWKQGFALFLTWWKHVFIINRMELCLSIYAGAQDKKKNPTSLQRGTDHNKYMCVRKTASVLYMGNLMITPRSHHYGRPGFSMCSFQAEPGSSIKQTHSSSQFCRYNYIWWRWQSLSKVCSILKKPNL